MGIGLWERWGDPWVRGARGPRGEGAPSRLPVTSPLQVPPPEGCTELSAPGDTVHIHYTVRAGGGRNTSALRSGGRGGGHRHRRGDLGRQRGGTGGGTGVGSGAVPRWKRSERRGGTGVGMRKALGWTRGWWH